MESITSIFAAQKTHFQKHKVSQAQDRIKILTRLRDVILENKEELQKTIHQDFRKAPEETDLTETFMVISEINHCIRHLKSWMRPQKVSATLTTFGTKSYVMYEPKGVVLILAPWNYPFAMVMSPLAGAIAAGNCVMIKPSELTPNTSRFLAKICKEVFPPELVSLIEGGVKESQELLKLPFDHIFFTGSTRIGKVVMEAAAKNLTPVTLELGGKCPAIIEDSADLDQAAQRIVWGKFVNAGQTCIAPDYVFVPKPLKKQFIQAASEHIKKFYGESTQARQSSKDFCRIVNESHFQRLKGLLDSAQASGAKIEFGGNSDPKERFIEPTLLSNVNTNSPIMKEEIFGPLLPILPYEKKEDVYNYINQGEKPLALYVFTRKQEFVQETLQNTSSGGSCVNNCLVHIANPNLPFGGVGPSGQGNYHGFFGFKTFSHERAVMSQGFYNSTKSFYPPYTDAVRKMIRFGLKYLS